MNNNEQTPDLTDLQILVVEDEAPIALQLEDMLTELGATVVGPASRVRQALQLLQEQRVDTAVLDLNIAGELVYPVAEALETKGLPYIFATGYGVSGLAEPYRSRVVLQKPFSRRELLRAIREVLPRP